ncbi:MAG: hypothetical protein ABEL04_04890 [Salinibacter sp.]
MPRLRGIFSCLQPVIGDEECGPFLTSVRRVNEGSPFLPLGYAIGQAVQHARTNRTTGWIIAERGVALSDEEADIFSIPGASGMPVFWISPILAKVQEWKPQELCLPRSGTVFRPGVLEVLSRGCPKKLVGAFPKRSTVGADDPSSRLGVGRSDNRSETTRVEKPVIDCLPNDLICRANVVEKALDDIRGSTGVLVNGASYYPVRNTDLDGAVARADDDYIGGVNVYISKERNQPPGLPRAPAEILLKPRIEIGDEPRDSNCAARAVGAHDLPGPPATDAFLLGTIGPPDFTLIFEAALTGRTAVVVTLRIRNCLGEAPMQVFPPGDPPFKVRPDVSRVTRPWAGTLNEKRRVRCEAPPSCNLQFLRERQAPSSKILHGVYLVVGGWVVDRRILGYNVAGLADYPLHPIVETGKPLIITEPFFWHSFLEDTAPDVYRQPPNGCDAPAALFPAVRFATGLRVSRWRFPCLVSLSVPVVDPCLPVDESGPREQEVLHLTIKLIGPIDSLQKRHWKAHCTDWSIEASLPRLAIEPRSFRRIEEILLLRIFSSVKAGNAHDFHLAWLREIV